MSRQKALNRDGKSKQLHNDPVDLGAGGKLTFRIGDAVGSAVGVDPGLASCGLVHIVSERSHYKLQPCSGVFKSKLDEASTVAESTARRTNDLYQWLALRLGVAVQGGAELITAERFEQVRKASAAAKAAAGHAALVCACAGLDPRPRLHASGGGPIYVPARKAKRAVTGCDVATKAVVERAVRRLVEGAAFTLDRMRKERRASECEHFADACAIALCALAHWERPNLLDEKVRAADSVPFDGLASERFMKLLEGEKVTSMRGAVALVNAFDLRAETETPACVFDGRAVIFVGDRAVRTFGTLAWQEVRTEEGFAYMAAALPHPGETQWWNKKNAAKARTFLRSAARV